MTGEQQLVRAARDAVHLNWPEGLLHTIEYCEAIQNAVEKAITNEKSSALAKALEVRNLRHREPHKCPRADISSACDFNRYGAWK